MDDFFPKAVAIAILGEIGLALGLAQVGYSPNDGSPLSNLGVKHSRPSRFIATTLRPPAPPPPPRVVPPPAPKVVPPTPLVRTPRRKVAKATPAPPSAPAPAPAPAPASASAPASAFGAGSGSAVGAGPACTATDSCRPASTPPNSNSDSNSNLPAPTIAPISETVLAEISDRIDRAARRNYPELARRRGIEGTVRVCFFVGPVGTASTPLVAQSSDDEDLDEAARAAVVAAAPLIAPRKHRLCKAIEYRLK